MSHVFASNLRYLLAAVLVCACWGAFANTLSIVTSNRGAGYDDLIDAMRNELSRTPGLKIQVLDAGSESVTNQMPDDTFMVVSVGVQATRQMMLQSAWRGPVLGVLVPRGTYEALPAGVKSQRRFSVIFLDQPPQRQIELIRVLLPTALSVGVVVGPASQHELEAYRSLAAIRGLNIVSEQASRDTELYPVLQSILRASDVLLALPDPSLVNVSTAQNLLLTSFRLRVPVIGYSAAYVRAGALAAVYSTPRQVGLEAASFVKQVLRGGSMFPTRYPRTFTVTINRPLALTLGQKVPDESAVLQRLQSMEFPD